MVQPRNPLPPCFNDCLSCCNIDHVVAAISDLGLIAVLVVLVSLVSGLRVVGREIILSGLAMAAVASIFAVELRYQTNLMRAVLDSQLGEGYVRTKLIKGWLVLSFFPFVGGLVAALLRGRQRADS